MTYEVREGQGSLFVNERKEGEQPDYRGNVRIGGVLYRLAGWKRRGKSGVGWLSLKAQPDERTDQTPPAKPPESSGAQPRHDFNDEIPF